MLTVQQFAAELNVSVSLVRKWIREDRLKIVRLGYNLIRIPESELKRVQSGNWYKRNHD